jgi:hypothetical protein
MTARVSTMVKVCSKASQSIGGPLEIWIHVTKALKHLKVFVACNKFSSTFLSESPKVCPKILDLTPLEFVVTSIGRKRPLIEEIRKEDIFTDTGKRIQFNTNLWGEVWRLKPEHLTLLQEKETQDEQTTSEYQSEH